MNTNYKLLHNHSNNKTLQYKQETVQLDITANVEQLYMSGAIRASAQTKVKWSTMPLNFMHDYEICQSEIVQYRNINKVSLYVQNLK
jgi:hypothetical protein